MTAQRPVTGGTRTPLRGSADGYPATDPCVNLDLSLHGARVRVALPSDADWHALRRRLPKDVTLAQGAEPDVSYLVTPSRELHRDMEILPRAEGESDLFDALISDLHFQFARHARTALFVHAGVVAVGGRVMIIPGRSYSGKSTLVAALVEAGAVYFSDEYAVFDRHGRVHPYPKPISLRDEAGIGRPIEAAELGGQSGSKPAPVGLVVHTRYDRNARWAPRPLDAAAALLALVDNTVRAREMPDLMLDILTGVVKSSPAIGGSRGEATDMIADLLRHPSLTDSSPRP